MDMCWLLYQKQVRLYIFTLVFLVLPGPVRTLQGASSRRRQCSKEIGYSGSHLINPCVWPHTPLQYAATLKKTSDSCCSKSAAGGMHQSSAVRPQERCPSWRNNQDGNMVRMVSFPYTGQIQRAECRPRLQFCGAHPVLCTVLLHILWNCDFQAGLPPSGFIRQQFAPFRVQMLKRDGYLVVQVSNLPTPTDHRAYYSLFLLAKRYHLWICQSKLEHVNT